VSFEILPWIPCGVETVKHVADIEAAGVELRII